MFSVFNDPTLQQQFESKGYILVPSLLNMEDIAALNQLFAHFQSEYKSAFHTTHFSSDVTYKKKVHETIAKLVGDKAAPYLNNFIPLFGNFMVKNPDPENFMPLHADWTYVDEKKFNSVSIWVPLIDVDTNNGCFGVVEGSHKITNSIRGPLLKQSSLKRDKIWEKRWGKLIPMKAGDAIIYNHSLLHYSTANKSSAVRPALNLSLVPQGISWVHYCKPEGADEIEVYKVTDSSFYIQYNNFQRPETGVLIDKLPNNVIEYIDERMENYGKTRNVFDQVKAWFVSQ